MEEKQKKKTNWKKTFKNNAFMLGLIAKSCPGLLVLQYLMSVLDAARFFMTGTYIYAYALNSIQEGRELKSVLITLAGLLAYSVFNTVLQNISNCYEELKRPVVEAYIQNMIQKKAAEADLSCFESSDFYDTYVKATEEASNRAFQVMYQTGAIVWGGTNATAIFALIATIEPLFILIALAPLLFTLVLGKKRNRINYDFQKESSEAARQRDYVRRTFYLNDFSKEMRLSAMWKVMFRRMRRSVAEMKEIVDKYGFRRMTLVYIMNDFVYDVVVYSSSIVIAAYRTLVSKTMLLGDCFVVLNSILNLASDIDWLGDIFMRFDENSLYIDNLRAFLDYEIRIAEDESAPCAPEFESLELKNVSFGYGESGENALSDVSFKVNAGEKIAIVGHNGAGKTTLIKLLLRLYDPSAGEILYNGRNIKEYRLSSYRNNFGTVFQDYQLFAVTVAENVMLRGNITDADRERVRDALTRSGVADRIDTLAGGVDTGVTKEFDRDGAVFSGGEAQKISIARIFAGDQEIVIMDEPTSALDPIAEQEMYKNMFEACEGKTVIFISHRLSSATSADRVYLFEHGRIVEAGTHSELLSLNAKYADMWHKQADTYSDAGEVSA